MNYLVLVFSGIVMGLVAAVPVGPVNLICVRRTFAYGPVNGFVSGLGAARIFGIAGKGRIALGYDADFTIVDLKAKKRIAHSQIASRCGWTPFDGL